MLPEEQLFPHINRLIEHKKRIIVAIDGMSAAGKSSFCDIIEKVFGSSSCNIIRMDHFFLRPGQRTSERLAEPGGNIDYERFIEEVVTPLASGDTFSYRPFNCKTQDFDEPITVEPKPLTIIEGVYSMTPEITAQSNYDITVFMKIDKVEQLRRLQERSPQMYERFINEWIPMENKYFETFNIREKCHYMITGDENE